MDMVRNTLNEVWAWLMRDAHRQKAQSIISKITHAFTSHPRASGETYRQHLWFTLTMAGHFVYIALVIVIHGLFPFLLPRTGSTHIEHVYRIIKARIPKARRDEIDLDYSV
jgi:uncharacterized protein YjeT (DUF2065 family)